MLFASYGAAVAAELIRPILTVDVVVLTLVDGRLHIVLQPRDKAPHRGRMALIGGYVHPEEDASTQAAATRVLRDKGGLRVRLLEQLTTFSGLDRDPRGWSASVAYYAFVPGEDMPAPTGRTLALTPLDRARDLPFDHDAIVAQARARWRRRAAYSSLPAFLLPTSFTLPRLRVAYEALLGRSLNDSAFRRKIDELRIVQPIEGATSRVTDRPARLYRLNQPRVVEFDRNL
jgi:8-oxo-dGTP diphosphatase